MVKEVPCHMVERGFAFVWVFEMSLPTLALAINASECSTKLTLLLAA